MTEAASAQVGDNLYDPSGHKIGKITDVTLDDQTLQPLWYVVRVGMRKGNHLVPVGSVSASDNGPAVPYDKERVQSAPQPDGPIPTKEEHAALSAHYGVREG
jgi:hypothetical protein